MNGIGTNHLGVNLAFTKFLFLTPAKDDDAARTRLRAAGGIVARGFFNDFEAEGRDVSPHETIQFLVSENGHDGEGIAAARYAIQISSKYRPRTNAVPIASKYHGVIATTDTSLYAETGAKRKDFGLADLFGVRFAGRTEGPMRNAYLRLEHQTAKDHPLLAGLADAPRIIHGVNRLEVTPTEKFPNPPLTHIPSYPDLPMEKVFMTTPRTDLPQVFLREIDAGRVAYFPCDIDRTFWEILDPDHGKLLRNAVTWATNEPPPVTVTGPGVLDVTFWQQKNSFTIHLVNLTNPMMMKGPIRELFPVGEQKVRARLPGGIRAKNVRLLVADAAATFRQADEWIEVSVSSIISHEVVAIEV